MSKFFMSIYISKLIRYSNQKNFGKLLFTSFRAICHSGRLGKLELFTLYAFRDDYDRIECGV